MKYLGKNKDQKKHVFLEVETGTEVELKIYYTKDFLKSMVVGEEGYAILNQDWVNDWQSLKKTEKPLTEVSTVEDRTTKNEYWDQRMIDDRERRKDILIQHYDSSAIEIVKELYRGKSFDEIDEKQLLQDRFRIVKQLMLDHSALLDQCFKEVRE